MNLLWFGFMVWMKCMKEDLLILRREDDLIADTSAM